METVTFKVLQVKTSNHLDYRSFVRNVDVPVEEVTSNVMEVLEKIFYYGQNDFQPKQSPSVSVGDVAVVNDKYYLCESFGWKEIQTVS